MYRVIAELDQSPVVRQVEIVNLINEPDLQVLNLKASLIDGSVLYIRETVTPTSDSTPITGSPLMTN
ncbi:MAG: hypothetical protein H5T62_17145 [Anaerolineae bacterium]|nr:hypothetical protein [Anaerolineae bacterium]